MSAWSTCVAIPLFAGHNVNVFQECVCVIPRVPALHRNTMSEETEQCIKIRLHNLFLKERTLLRTVFAEHDALTAKIVSLKLDRLFRVGLFHT